MTPMSNRRRSSLGTDPASVSTSKRWTATTLAATCIVGACVGLDPDRSAIAEDDASAAERGAAIAIEHLELELALDPVERSIEGVARLELVALAPRVDWVPLALEDLEVSSIVTDEGTPLAHSHQDGSLAVMLPEPLMQGAGLSLAITYAGSPTRGLDFAHAAELDSVFVRADGQAGAAARWYPCLEESSTRFDAALELSLPEDWIASGVGRELPATAVPVEGRSHQRFETSSPITAERLAFVAGPFATAARADQGVLVLGSETRRTELERAADEAARARLFGRAWFDGLEQVIDPAAGPLERMTLVHASAPDGAGGQRLGYLTDLRLPTVSAATLTHEARARVVPAARDDEWVGAALGRQALIAYAAELGGENARVEAVERLAIEVAEHRPAGSAGVLSTPSDSDSDAFVDEPWRAEYGTQLLTLVRGALGPVEFGRRLRELMGRAATEALSTRSTFETLLTGVDGVSVGDLDWQQWVERPGRPRLELIWEYDASAAEVVLRVRQSQESSDGTPRVYRFPAAVEVAVGPRMEAHRLVIADRVETFRLPADERPIWVRFDVEGWLPAELIAQKDLAEWFAISSDTARAAGRVRAAEALADRARSARKSERTLFLTHFNGRLRRDPSARARCVAAEALGGLGGEAAERWLRQAAVDDTDTSVRLAAIDALVELAADANTDLGGFAERLSVDDPAVSEAALRLRAATGGADAAAYLRQRFRYSDDPESRVAALAVLIEVADTDLEPLLVDAACDTAESLDVRLTALEALGRRGDLSDRGIERVGGVLEEELSDVREAAIATLVEQQSERAREVLEAYLPQAVEPVERRAIEASLELEK